MLAITTNKLLSRVIFNCHFIYLATSKFTAHFSVHFGNHLGTLSLKLTESRIQTHRSLTSAIILSRALMHPRSICFSTVYNRYLKLFWPNNSAFIDSKCHVRMGRSALERYTKGLVLIEVPLTTRHSATVDYSYDVSKSGPPKQPEEKPFINPVIMGPEQLSETRQAHLVYSVVGEGRVYCV